MTTVVYSTTTVATVHYTRTNCTYPHKHPREVDQVSVVRYLQQNFSEQYSVPGLLTHPHYTFARLWGWFSHPGLNIDLLQDTGKRLVVNARTITVLHLRLQCGQQSQRTINYSPLVQTLIGRLVHQQHESLATYLERYGVSKQYLATPTLLLTIAFPQQKVTEMHCRFTTQQHSSASLL